MKENPYEQAFWIGCWIGCLMFIIACSSSKTTPNSPYARTIAETQALIETQMQEQQIVGLSIVLVDAEAPSENRIIWSRGFGMADNAQGILSLSPGIDSALERTFTHWVVH
jgi:hypothetical protein